MSPRSNREPLHVWLKNLLDSSKCPGVTWEDRDKGIFRIPWVNQKSQEWIERDSGIFLEYAIFTGKYKPGDKKDFPTFKQNLKSALDKNPIVERMKPCLSKNYRRYVFRSIKKETSQISEIVNFEHEHQELSASQSGSNEITVAAKDNNSAQYLFVFGDSSFSSSKQSSLFLLENIGAPSKPVQGYFTTYFDKNTVPINPWSQMLNSSSGVLDKVALRTADPTNNDVNKISQEFSLPAKQLELKEHSEEPSFLCEGVVDITADSLDEDHSNIEVHGEKQIAYFKEEGCRSSPRQDISKTACDDQTKTDISMMETFFNRKGIQNSTQVLYDRPTDTKLTSGVLYLKSENLESHKQTTSVSVSVPDTCGQKPNDLFCSMDTTEGNNVPEKQKSKEILEPNPVMSLIPIINTGMTNEQESDLIRIQVRYGIPETIVFDKNIKAPKCKIFFGKTKSKRLQKIVDVYDNDAIQIELPSVSSVEDKRTFGEKSKKKINDVLEKMELGVVISYKNDDIYIVRRCKLHVFLSDGVSTGEPLPRSHINDKDEEIKAFDFKDFHLSSVKKNKEKNTPTNNYYFNLCLGYPFDCNNPGLPVVIRVEHLKAARMFADSSSTTSGPEYSLSDSFDNLLSFSRVIPTSLESRTETSGLMSVDYQPQTIIPCTSLKLP